MKNVSEQRHSSAGTKFIFSKLFHRPITSNILHLRSSILGTFLCFPLSNSETEIETSLTWLLVVDCIGSPVH